MSLYFNYKVDVFPNNAIHVNASLHSQHKILAVASHSEDKGGTVTVCNDEGELVKGASSTSQISAQAVTLSWHPFEKTLAVGWENGSLSLWLEERLQFVETVSPHQAPIGLLGWSSQGSRLLTGDATGMVVAWRADSKGVLQIIFQSDLKEPLTCFAFRNEDTKIDISGLAKAAVEGDEHALDMFSSWRPKTASSRLISKQGNEGTGFFVGSISGAIYYCNEEGQVIEVCNEHSPIKKMLFHSSKFQLVVLTDNLGLSHYNVQPDGQLLEITRLKLSGRSQDAVMVWCGANSIAVSTRELSVRCLDLETNDNYLLTLDNPSDREHFICLDFNMQRSILCGGTSLGRVAIWKHTPSSEGDPENAWKLQMPNKLTGGAIQHILWGVGGTLLAVHTVKEIFLLREQQICAQFCSEMSAVQVAPNQLTVSDGEGPMELCSDTQLRGIALDGQQVVIWGTKRVNVYELNQRHFKVVGSFACECIGAVILEHTLYCIEGNNVQIRTTQGTIKQSLTFAADEGEPIGIELCGHFLTVATLLGWIKVWDLSRREAKLHANPKYLNDVILDFGEIILARSNCEGSKVSITVAKSNLLPDCKLYLWATDSDTLASFDFAGQEASLTDRFVLSHMWDSEEPKLLVCEAKLQPKLRDQRQKRMFTTTSQLHTIEKPEVLLVTMFAASDGRLLIQSSEVLPDPFCRLIGVCAPHYILLRKPSGIEKEENTSLVGKVSMPDFEGLSNCDKTTKDAIINFSYHLTIGNMDEAFKAIRAIKITTVWESMAKMCVKTKRLDVALVCLGHMKHARGAIQLKKAMEREPELDAQVACLALQLRLNDEAEKLYKSCGRSDLLNKFYQDTEQWDKAIQVAETQDRIHLKTTYYNYAKHLEFIGDLNAAIAMYEKSDTHRFEVPRMLMEDQNLEFYMTNNKDSHLLKWWAQYLESNGDMEGALEYYEKSNDTLSLVRVHCFCEKFENAIRIASESEDKAACYHLARQLENANQVEKAIEFFFKAQAHGNAIRLCKEQGMNEQVWSLALKAGPQDQLEAAQYFEQADMPERAVRLYHKAGMLHKAVDLAFQAQQYSALQSIVVDLDSNSDPNLLMKCAKFFVDNKQFEKAVDMLAIAKQFNSAIELCVQNNVPVTEELAEKLTMDKSLGNEEERSQVLLAVAESAQVQGNYHLAAKKFTQAGDRLRAMKSLLKSGDTEKIVYYTNVSRQKDIYIMAANYLQSLDWRNSPDIMKNIIAFYSKGRALDLLAEFYVACAQVEVDEFRDYEKALGAYVEASRCIARGMASNRASEGTSVEGQKQRGQELARRLDLIKKYVEVKRLFERESDTALSLSRELLQVPDVEATVRRGDVFALMISHHLRAKSVSSANQVLEEMRAAGINPTYYLDAEVLRALGMPGQSGHEPITRQQSSVEDEIEEQVEEDTKFTAMF